MNNFDNVATQSFAVAKEYTKHKVFADLDYYISFYDSFSMSILHFATMDTKAIMNIDSYVYSSIQGTLESINLTLKNGHISDAYALLRKYYDAAIMNVYTNLYLEEELSKNDLNKLLVDKIQNWLNGTEQLPDFRTMSNFIRREPSRLKQMNDLLDSDERYKKIRERCNDSTHYNFFTNVLLNDSNVYVKDRLKWVDIFTEDLKEIFLLHIGYIFFLCPHYMSSSDYLDALEAGLVPEEDSQYLVAPFIQDAFDKIVSKSRYEIAALIKENSSMQLHVPSQ